MSGICGISSYDNQRRVDPDHLSVMVGALSMAGQGETLTVRLGPVGFGTQQFSGQLAGVADIAIQGQPLVLAIYGSLYNLQELCPSTSLSSNPFQVLLSLYVEEGLAFLQRLRGEFAVAIWDGREEKLCLATDRFRVQPLFYYEGHDALVFASRMRGILACPLATARTINLEAIVDVVSSSFIPTPKTIFKEVKKLPPGHFLTCHRGRIEVQPYWDINFLQTDWDEVGLGRKLKQYFSDAVSIRLNADASDRIGTFLSGGVDSSTVTGILTQLTQHPIKSFSIGFGEEKFNEISYSRIAAQSFGAQHFEYFVTPRDTYEAVPVLLEAFDEPFANASAVPTYFCARLARQHGVGILYAGDGGDELFAGNERYATQRSYDSYRGIPRLIREGLVRPVISVLADRLKWSMAIKGKKYIERITLPYPERLFLYGFFKIVPMVEFLEDGLLEAIGKSYDPYASICFHYFRASARTDLDRQLYIDLKLAISDNDLFKVNRMTEAAGVTVRYPFLDHQLAEFAATVPAAIKMRGRELRTFFKKAYADLLPSEVISKKKHGFGLPIPIWLRSDKSLNEMMHETVLSPRSVQRGYFRQQALEEIVERHKTDESSFYGSILWNLMMLELWHRAYAN